MGVVMTFLQTPMRRRPFAAGHIDPPLRVFSSDPSATTNVTDRER
jgi:hypothetical protein